MQPHLYRLYNLFVQSPLPCPYLWPAEGELPDVTIKIGPTPTQLEHVSNQKVRFQLNESQFLLQIDGIGNYFVEDGRSMTIQPITEPQVALEFAWGSAFGALLQQRQTLALHACALTKNNQTVVVVGNSGAGKSTTAASLLERGFSLLSDDVCPVISYEGGLGIPPGPMRIKLWHHAIQKLDQHERNYVRIRPQVEKYWTKIDTQFAREIGRLSHIFVLEARHQDKLETTPIKGSSKFKLLTKHTYRRQYMKNLPMIRQHFVLASQIAMQIPITRIKRPKLGFTSCEVADVIEAQIS